MKQVEIHTDGACSGNPGPGGWAAILVYKKFERELSGGEKLTTNNRMELTAAIKGLEALNETCEVLLHSDSQYLVGGMTKGWAKSWRRNGWVKSDKKPALNPELWERLLELCEKHKVEFIWVRGHNGDTYNERCDLLAVAQRDRFSEA